MKNIPELDLDFDNSRVDLYVVVDTTTNLEVSPVIQVKNDCLAVDAFKHFLEEQKEKKAPYSHFVMLNLGCYNLEKHKIENGEVYTLVTEDDNVEDYLNDIVNYIKSLEEDEE